MHSRRNYAKSLYHTGVKLFQVLFVLVFSFSLLGVQPVKPVQAATTVSLPSAGETYLREGYATRNYGGTATVNVSNRTSGQNALFKWDLSSILPGSTVTAASLSFYVTESSEQDFSLFSMRRAWIEGTSNDAASSTSANWDTYDGSNTWGTGGAKNTDLDRYDTDLWDATGGSGGTFSTEGNVTIPLNPSGVAAVQGWVNNSSINFGVTVQFTGTPSSTADYWTVASKENTSSYAVPTLNVTYEVAGPTIFTSVSQLESFATPPGTPSQSKTYNVSGVLLTNDIVISAPPEFEISTDGVTWENTLTLEEEGGTVDSTPIYVHMTGVNEGDFSDVITHISTPATQKNVAVSGTVALIPERVSKQVGQSSDDAEESVSSGTVDNNSTDLELIYDSGTGANQQIVGMRFQDIQVPPGALVQNAYIEFTAKNTASTTVNLTISGQDDPNPLTFSETDDNISSRTKTTAEVSWVPEAWTEGDKYTTSDLKTIVQEIVDRGDWSTGNAMVFIVEGTETTYRNAQSYDESSHTKGPTLVIDYFISDVPIMTTSVSELDPFAALPGVPSDPKSYNVTGFNLSAGITVTAPTGFQLSDTIDGTYAGSLSLPAAGGTVFVRLFNASLGTYDGNIEHTSGIAAQKNVAVEGEVSNTICYDVSLAATEDNYLSAANVQYNNGGSDIVRVDANTGTSGRTGLLKWDLSSIPTSATIQSASLKLNVTEASEIGFDLYNMRRTWVEGTGNRDESTDSSNWNTYDGFNSWGTAGAVNTEFDRFNDNLWSAEAGSFTSGSKTFPLNTIGVGVIQGWVSESLTNYGLTMQNNVSTTADAVQFDSSEDTTTTNRPAMLINYCVGEINSPPAAPVLVQPLDDATDVVLPPTLEVTVTDPDEDEMDVSFYGRPVSSATPAEDFMIIAVPDTQGLAQSYNTVLQNQFGWIANRYTNPSVGEPDLVFVTHLGDLVNTSSSATQWQNIDAAFDQFDPINLPYSVGPGNHDIAMGTTSYSTYFGSDRFNGKAWYGGDYDSGSDNYNSYSLFSAGGMDFILINLQYNPGSGALDWADALLKANTDRRGIIEQHDILNIDNSWNNQASYTALSDNPNLFLMLCGHMHSSTDGSAYRLETRTEMDPVHIVQTDYQDFAGQDYIRLLTFKPALDEIYAQVFSPYAPGGYLTSETNYEQFTMTYDMVGSAAVPFSLIGTATNVANGSNASISWTGLASGTEYEWYAVASDGSLSTSTESSPWSFTTAGPANVAPVLGEIGNKSVNELAQLSFTATATDEDIPGQTLTFSLVGAPSGASITAGGAFTWTPTESQGPSTPSFDVCVSDGALSDCETITVTVNEVNVAPVLGEIGNKTIGRSLQLSFIATATDADVPANTLTYSLAPVASGTIPAGATIDGSSGAFTWTPSELGDYTFDVCVSDGPLSDCETITVTVTEAPLCYDLVFQDGLEGYAGTVDTYIMESEATASFGDQDHVEWDAQDPYNSDPQTANYGLLRFDNIFGSGTGQIPLGATIETATFTYVVSNTGDSATVNDAAVSWNEAVTYDTFGIAAGVQEADYGTLVGTATGETGAQTLDVKGSLQRWSEGATNYGWLFRPDGTDGVEFRSSEYTTSADRPKLSVRYCLAPTGPTITPSVASLPAFSALPGAASSVSSYTVEAVNLENNLVITAPADFQISESSTTGFGQSLTLVPDGGGITSKTIYVRFSRTTEGTSSGVITHVSLPAAQKDVAVTGTAALTPPWTAYNDMSGTSTPANTTEFTLGQTNGMLKDFDTGDDTGVTVTVTSAGDPFNYTDGGQMPDSGTDAYEVFNGKVDLQGVIMSATSNPTDYYVDVTFNGLDATKTYTFVTTANRAGGTGGDGVPYPERETRYTISGMDAAVNASSDGVNVIDPNSVYFVTGENTAAGYVAKWVNIQPGADGSFKVHAQPQDPDEPRTYTFGGFMLQEEVSTMPDVEITDVAVTGITAPVALADPDLVADISATPADGIDSATAVVTWDPDDSPFDYSEVYTASVTLVPADGYEFTAETEVTVNGQTPTSVTLNVDGTLTVTYQFTATGPEPVTYKLYLPLIFK